MSNGIQNSASMKLMKRQTVNRSGPIKRKRNGEQMQNTELVQLSSPSPLKKGSLAELPLVFFDNQRSQTRQKALENTSQFLQAFLEISKRCLI